jgi:predicted transposase YbfD/YdcC
LVDVLACVPDPRDPRGIRHQIGAVLAVMVFAVLTGAGKFREIADRAVELPPELLAVAGCRRDRVSGGLVVPSEATMRKLAHAIDADAADARVCRWLRERVQAAALVAVAIDGKVVRNTIAPGGSDGGEIKLFSALRHDEAVVIAQRRIPAGTNEITQVAALLAEVDLAGVVVTGDAAHAQHATAAHLTTDRGGAYVLTVKGDHPPCSARSWRRCRRPLRVPSTMCRPIGGKGRIVRRAIWVAPAGGVGFPGVAQVFRIRRDTFDHLGRRLTKEVVHGVTSLTVVHTGPDLLAGLVRSHGGIENKSHWVRDVVFGEDHQHVYAGTGAQVMATLRNLALGLLRLAGVTQITRTLQRIAADRTRIFPIIAAATSTNRL